MSVFIVALRNPRNGKVLTLMEEDETTSSFATEKEADRVAGESALCRAWGYQVLEVE